MTDIDPDGVRGGVILLAVIMLVYETLGGFRAVAWTDMIQGGILMVGFKILLLSCSTTMGWGKLTSAAIRRAGKGGCRMHAQTCDGLATSSLRDWVARCIRRRFSAFATQPSGAPQRRGHNGVPAVDGVADRGAGRRHGGRLDGAVTGIADQCRVGPGIQ